MPRALVVPREHTLIISRLEEISCLRKIRSVMMSNRTADLDIVSLAVSAIMKEYADHSSSLGVLSRDNLHLVHINDTSVDSKVIIGNYIAEVSRLTYGSKQLGLDRQKKGNGRIVFDSGSSYTYFTKQAYSDLVSMLKDVSRDGFSLDPSDTTLPICFRPKVPVRSIKDVSKFLKPLTLQFAGRWWSISTNLQIHPEGYLIMSNKGNVCLGILDGSDLLDGSHIVLGDMSMRGNLIVYDNVKQKVGWMRSDCVNPKQSKKYLPYFEA